MPDDDDEPWPGFWLPSDRAWLDPPLVARQLYTQFSEVDTDPAESVKAAGYNPLRWGIGFSFVTFGGTVKVSPVALAVADVGGWQLTEHGVLWFNLRDHTVLVTGEWYLQRTSASRLRVYEVIRQA